MAADFSHLPVLQDEVISFIKQTPMRTVVDCTLGGGGHTLSILEAASAERVIGIDQDSEALAAAQARLKQFDNIEFVKSNFGDLRQVLADYQAPIDAFLFDLGVSSWQLDSAQRGFSYQHSAPLDMRMDQDSALTAREIVNNWSQQELTRIFREFGEERWASRIAQFIVERRNNREIVTTADLVEIIKAAIPAAARRKGGHPGRRVFQALRIAVNGELDSLAAGLEAAIDLLAPGGRIIVISYHSLEDRIVKRLFREQAEPCRCPKEIPVCVCGTLPVVRVVNRKPVVPESQEIELNPRARSAKLRVAEKLSSKENRG
ncbi:MAG: 16S rRNA (cytosine(1402)-N(4))-methyltransferase RsmH [Firmicutes bacterium]|nr:16S rRNA (cytosine(1402)-N(4))-methyltransferase RsmH [Bacillota bacterium]